MRHATQRRTAEPNNYCTQSQLRNAELWSTNERSVLRPLEGVSAPEDGSLLQGDAALPLCPVEAAFLEGKAASSRSPLATRKGTQVSKGQLSGRSFHPICSWRQPLISS
ncbi:g12370 [Coccomyxa viridis]|uniref:G12370 protein n=1 Tax=Coccomyxa viridis TaxID=1274662 RepID=A0ABP1GAJ0_9CHLO